MCLKTVMRRIGGRRSAVATLAFALLPGWNTSLLSLTCTDAAGLPFPWLGCCPQPQTWRPVGRWESDGEGLEDEMTGNEMTQNLSQNFPSSHLSAHLPFSVFSDFLPHVSLNSLPFSSPEAAEKINYSQTISLCLISLPKSTLTSPKWVEFRTLKVRKQVFLSSDLCATTPT